MKLFLFALLCCFSGKYEANPTALNNPSKQDLLQNDPNPEASNRFFTDDGDYLFQGDMVLNSEQYDAIFGPIQTRKAINDLTKRWTDARVPFAISQSSEVDRDVIISGLQHWEANTCVKFEEVDEDANEPHMIFEKKKGCNSPVGMQPRNGQTVSIGKNCESMGTVVHEVGHSLGFYHEQSRTDRDQYIKVLEHNINKSHAFNFNIQFNTDNYGVPYDVGSIMQYGTTAFTVNGRNTMVPLDIRRTFDLGQHNGLSFADVKLATIIYDCAGHCTSKPNCQNNGFVDFKCRCRCPPGFVGSNCERQVQLPAPICGGDFNSPTHIQTPNYPNKYPKDTSCIWIFKAPAGRRVRVAFDNFDLIYKHEKKCIWDSLEVRTTDKYEGEMYCSDDLKDTALVSGGNEMILLFHAEYDYNTGFEADIDFV